MLSQQAASRPRQPDLAAMESPPATKFACRSSRKVEELATFPSSQTGVNTGDQVLGKVKL